MIITLINITQNKFKKYYEDTDKKKYFLYNYNNSESVFLNECL